MECVLFWGVRCVSASESVEAFSRRARPARTSPECGGIRARRRPAPGQARRLNGNTWNYHRLALSFEGMKTEIISIGSELTSGQNLDTNAQWLSQRLAEVG